VLQVALILAGSIYALALNNLARPSSITSFHPSLELEPEQKLIKGRHFEMNYGDRVYRINPLAEYEISGLVVTHNNISSITDAYHTSKSVDLKDLCLVWGDNLSPSLLKNVTFWSEPWTCFFLFHDNDTAAEFSPNQISNNHLIGANQQVRNIIKQVHVGDQVTLRGSLVEYSDIESSEQIRRSSLTREDTGNGACEVVYVEQISILKQGTPIWRRILEASKKVGIIMIILNLISFLIFPFIEYRSGY